jgi:hypothetical protein
MAGYTSPDGNFSLSGFGTLGVSRTTTDEALFLYPGQGGGSGRDVSLNPDTKIAVQGTYKFAPTLSATTQLMTKYDANGQYTPNLEWMFGKWQALPSVTLRAGRMGAPFFMVSDFRDVGFANTAVRPNLDVYGQVPFSSFEGLDASHQASFGPVTLTSTIWAGNAKSKYTSALLSGGLPADPVELTLKKTVGLNFVAELDNGLTLRAGHTQGKLSSASASAAKVIAAAHGANLLSGSINDTQEQEVVTAMTTQDSNASFSGLGLSYDQNDIVLSAEFTKRKSKTGYIADTKGWYAMGGYRFGSLLPYVSVSRLTTVDPNVSISAGALGAYGVVYQQEATVAAQNQTALSNLGTYAAGAYAGAQAILNTQKQSQNTISGGVRWDVQSGLALKAQFDHVNVPKNSNGWFLVSDPVKAVQGGNKFLDRAKDINVLSVSVDFIF